MSDYESSTEGMSRDKDFVPKEHFLFDVPKDTDELRTRLMSALDAKNRGFVHNPNVATSQHLYDHMGNQVDTVPMGDVTGWTYAHGVAEFLNEERGDGRGVDHIMEIIRGWNGDGEDDHQTMSTDGLTFISNEPGKYILNEGKHRYLAAIAMGIQEFPAKIEMYTKKPI
jgi:hypothetical protein